MENSDFHHQIQDMNQDKQSFGSQNDDFQFQQDNAGYDIIILMGKFTKGVWAMGRIRMGFRFRSKSLSSHCKKSSRLPC